MTSPQSSPSGAPESGRALDAMIAEKVMGLPRHEWPLVCVVDRHETDQGIWCYTCGAMVDGQEQVPPRYSTDIASAWLVVEKMRANGLRPVLMPDWNESWQCVVYRRADFIKHSPFLRSLPHAICLAALACVASLVPSTGAETAE